VAALFALHPLHVESVAWIAERKDVLSGLFFILTLGAYTGYARSPSASRYLLVLGLFVLALCPKPSWVTLPFVCCCWTTGRFNRLAGHGANEYYRANLHSNSRSNPWAAVKKATFQKLARHGFAELGWRFGG